MVLSEVIIKSKMNDRKKRELKGKIFGRLTVISEHGRSNAGKVKWLCKCLCGKEIVCISGNLISGTTTSCGCYMLEQQTKHGDHKTKFYGVWRDMRYRCNSPSCSQYYNYGGRGIKVCPEWEDYLIFKRDMFDSYQEGLSIDRIDTNGDYKKSNCKWSTQKEQNRNQRRNNIIDTEWGAITVTEASERSGINRATLFNRLRKGLTGKDLFSPLLPGGTLQKLKAVKVPTPWGDMIISEASELMGLDQHYVRSKLSKGFTIEDIAKQKSLLI